MINTRNRFRLSVFGLGEVGQALTQTAARLGWTVDGFSRSQALGAGRTMDASRDESVQALSSSLPQLRSNAVVVTFPPQQAAPSFWALVARLSDRRILLGSTSIYRRIGSGRGRITEETPLRPGHDRLEAETDFLQRGGVVVRLSGIYSRTRNPVRWVKQGRVGYEDRQVNLVHTEDIARAVARIASAPEVRPLYNLADGQEHTWVQIIDRLVQAGTIAHSREPAPLKREDGFVANDRFLADFEGFRFRDFWMELADLSRESPPISLNSPGGS